jgi:hypothetical protein
VFGQKYLFVKDASQGFNYSEVLQSHKISGSLSAVRTMCHPVRMPICHCSILLDDVPYRPDARQTTHHPFGRHAFPSGPSIVSRRFFPTCIRLDVLAARPDALCTRPAPDSFQVPIKGRSTNRPDDVVSRSDAHLHKARIAIQIHPSGRQTALVRMRVHQRRKLSIRLQQSGRLPIMVRTRAHQLWKLHVEDQPCGRSSPMVRTREALYGKYLQRTCNRPDAVLK